jgi:inosine triphosphate pyrophosphatase
MSDQPRPRLLNFITGNANKLNEVRAILSAVPGLELQSRNVEGVEIQGSIEEVARDKCSRAARAVRFSRSLSLSCPFLIRLRLFGPAWVEWFALEKEGGGGWTGTGMGMEKAVF